MKRVSVQSSNICSIGYDENQSILQVEFNNGSIYNYLISSLLNFGFLPGLIMAVYIIITMFQE